MSEKRLETDSEVQRLTDHIDLMVYEFKLEIEIDRLKAENESLRADAKLGRMVRHRVGLVISHRNVGLGYEKYRFCVSPPWQIGETCTEGWGDTPEAALRAAGLGETEEEVDPAGPGT
jgi:hypothetical protein